MTKLAKRKYLLLVVIAVAMPVLFGFQGCEYLMNCNEEVGRVIPDYLNHGDQQDDARILVIGDSIVAYYHGVCWDTGFATKNNPNDDYYCYKSIGDKTSQALYDSSQWQEDVYVWTYARGGEKLSFPGWVDPGANLTYEHNIPIPHQYCVATRGLDSRWNYETNECDGGDGPRQFDWVILHGGGNDMKDECAKPGGLFPPSCTDHCYNKMIEVFNEAWALANYIENEAFAPQVIVVGKYRNQNNSAYDWYNTCADYVNLLGAYAVYYSGSTSIFYLQPTSYMGSDTYHYNGANYTDTVHPSHSTVDKISAAIVNVINPPSP